MKYFKTVGLATVLGVGAFFATNPLISEAQTVVSWENGKAVYETTCVACHGENGKGTIPGVPDFTKKKSPLGKLDEELFNNVKNGFQSPGSFMAMPALGGNPDLTDQEVRDVIEYLRAEFGKK